ncbi:hypothetical protein [Leptolyngbya sp. Cla-17]|uniref:hypothetical protein n=1 Tax=Leptolyngbya sp. Cla-17 TaxID=2803751 RepID=UPI001FD8B42A|nr:hypothetical protein [Leptolyngbya sp. Cla-17]
MPLKPVKKLDTMRAKGEIIAFEIANRGSRRIDQSQVLPGLAVALLEEALHRSRQTNHGKVSAWLLSQLQSAM